MPAKKGDKKSKISSDPRSIIGKYYDAKKRSAESWMWIGVFGLGALIAVIWGISLKVQMETSLWQKGADAKLFKEVKQDWNQAFADRAENQNNAISARARLSQIIGQLLQTAATSSQSSTPASATPATTSPNNPL
ncbi:MAG: hypothetical protein Q7K39_03550 [Candidatus Magasanikbacteria bacterium]|nr:hypothetical protein [Candidatus Magasanikbacteria bacterium]